MASKLFSFLGTSKYEPCYYVLDGAAGKIVDSNYRTYVQEALLNLLPKAGRPLDEVVVFLTADAAKRNWLRNYNERYGMPGLKDALESHGHIAVSSVNIPVGVSEPELWEIFEKLFDQIAPGDEIIFDITHSFRSIPMLAIIILNYAKFVKGIDITGIYYGAVETLGSPREISNLPVEERICPIFNLTPFAELLDWTAGIEKFLNTGDVRQIVALIGKQATKFGKVGECDKANFLNRLKNSLGFYIHSIATNRGPQLSTTALQLKDELKEVIQSPELIHVRPVKPLLRKIETELEPYTNDEHMNMLNVVRWCSERNLIQQGITILQEGLVTYVCDRYGLDAIDRDNRNLISQVVRIALKNIPFSTWVKEVPKKVKLVERILEDEYFHKVAALFHNMSATRNDINHAGWRKQPAKPKQIEDKLQEFLSQASALIKEGQKGS